MLPTRKKPLVAATTTLSTRGGAMREEKKKQQEIGAYTIHVRVTREPGGNWVPTLRVEGPGSDGYSSTYYRKFDEAEPAFEFAFAKGRAIVAELQRGGLANNGTKTE
jgi:hypothetical protein